MPVKKINDLLPSFQTIFSITIGNEDMTKIFKRFDCIYANSFNQIDLLHNETIVKRIAIRRIKKHNFER